MLMRILRNSIRMNEMMFVILLLKKLQWQKLQEIF
jgi:hypothetical protein